MMEWIFSSSVLILIVLALRWVLRGKVSLRLQYGLWALVLLRLLTPLSFFSTGFSVQNFTTQFVPSVEEIAAIDLPRQSYSDAYEQVVREYGAKGIDVERLNGSELETLDYEAMERMNSGVTVGELVGNIALAVWLAGIAIFLSVTLGCNLRFRAKLRRDRVALEVPNTSLPVYVTHQVQTPCLFGLFRPAIYLTPEVAVDETRLRHVLEHELTHYYHCDYITAPLRCIALALHWYNPLVWVAAKAARQDGELACDEGTIARLGESERIEYGHTLIELTCERTYVKDVMLTATTMTGSARSIKERIRRIANQPKMAVYTLIAVILIAAVAVGCTFTGAMKDSETTDVQENGENWMNSGESIIGSHLREAMFNKDDVQAAEMVEFLMESVEKRDIEAIRQLFSENTSASVDDLDVQITSLFEYYEGSMVSVDYKAGSSSGQSDAGLNIREHTVALDVSTTEQEYCIAVKYCTSDTEDSGNIGIQSLYMIWAEYTDPVFCYWGGREWTPGIVIQREKIAATEESIRLLMAQLIKEDMVEVWINGGSEIPLEELATAINGAAYKGIDYSEVNHPHWSVYIFLDGEPGKVNTQNEHLTLKASTEENRVYVRYWDGVESVVNFGIEDKNLYWLIRNAHKMDSVIDEVALAEYREIINDRAKATAQTYEELPDVVPFTGYDITEFVLKDSFERDGERYDVYEWDVAYTVDDPNEVYWAGGMSLDGDLRVRNFEQETFFAVRIADGEMVDHSFLGWDLYGMGATEQEIWDNARNTIVKSFNAE